MFRVFWPACVRAFSLRTAVLSAWLSTLMLFPSNVRAADTGPVSTPGKYIVATDKLVIDDMRLDDTIDIMLLSPDVQLGGFKLKLAVPTGPVEVVDIIRGEICDSCHWELFQPRRIDSGGNYQIWQVVAMADMMPDAVKPGCFGLGRAASLARIIVTGGSKDVPDTTIPIYFWWENCSDNSISGTSGNTLYLSQEVVDETSADVNTRPRNDCIKANNPNAPVRGIEFRNGEIQFKLVMEKDSL